MGARPAHTDGERGERRVPKLGPGENPPFGFSEPGSAPPWLPQPAEWKGLTAEAQVGQEPSMLSLYRDALRLRRATPGLGDGPMAWLPSDPDVLAFTRGDRFACCVHTSDH